MTVFAKMEDVNVTVWSPIMDQLGALQLAMGAPHDLMMFLAKKKGAANDTVFLALPDRTLLRQFPGFTEIEREELPDYLSTLIVREDGFKEMFPDIFNKRRTRFG